MGPDAGDDRRQPYTPPELTRHGRLDELTEGAGSKESEKTSSPDTMF